MTEDHTINPGSTVRILDSSATHKAGLVDLTGVVTGWTTPSIIDVEIIGELTGDVAINVTFVERKEDFWFSPDLLLIEYVDASLGPATRIDLGCKKWTRTEDGGWKETT